MQFSDHNKRILSTAKCGIIRLDDKNNAIDMSSIDIVYHLDSRYGKQGVQ